MMRAFLRWNSGAVLAVALCLLGLGSATATAQGAGAICNGDWFAYAAREPGPDGDYEIYLMSLNGQETIQLTDNEWEDSDVVWSPDGSRLAFTADPDGNDDVFVMNADGSNLTRLTDNPRMDRVESWSPDGSALGVTSSTDILTWQIGLIDPDTGAISEFSTQFGDPEKLYADLSWSGDGRTVTFSSTQDGNGWNVFVMPLDTMRPMNITVSPEGDEAMLPIWSSSHDLILYGSSPKDWYMGPFEWRVIRPDGAGMQTIHVAAFGSTINWSPDGELLIASTEGVSGIDQPDWGIYIMQPDGTGIARIPNTSHLMVRPAWQPRLCDSAE